MLLLFIFQYFFFTPHRTLKVKAIAEAKWNRILLNIADDAQFGKMLKTDWIGFESADVVCSICIFQVPQFFPPFPYDRIQLFASLLFYNILLNTEIWIEPLVQLQLHHLVISMLIFFSRCCCWCRDQQIFFVVITLNRMGF